MIDWTVIHDEASASKFAAAIEDTPRQLFSGGTSISGAIDYGVALLLKSPLSGSRGASSTSRATAPTTAAGR